MDLSVFMMKDTWVGLAIGAFGMDEGTDMLVFNGSTYEVTDKHSAGYLFPSSDDS